MFWSEQNMTNVIKHDTVSPPSGSHSSFQLSGLLLNHYRHQRFPGEWRKPQQNQLNAAFFFGKESQVYSGLDITIMRLIIVAGGRQLNNLLSFQTLVLNKRLLT